MQNHLAMIVPVNYPKIDRFNEFYKSYQMVNPDIDFYAVISEEESNKLDEYNQIIPEETIIICPDVNSSKNPITYKKMFALKHLHALGQYCGYATPDCECLFVRGGFDASFMKFYYEREIVCYPTDVDFLINIQKESCIFFEENSNLKIFKSMYSFWNTLPWYVDLHLDSFFNDTKYDSGTFFNCKWEVFDHLCYQAWLVHKGLFKISEKQFRLEYTEDMKPKELEIFENVDLDWLRYGARNHEYLRNQKPLMYFHADRDQ